jgi:hypothetical protein
MKFVQLVVKRSLGVRGSCLADKRAVRKQNRHVRIERLDARIALAADLKTAFFSDPVLVQKPTPPAAAYTGSPQYGYSGASSSGYSNYYNPVANQASVPSTSDPLPFPENFDSVTAPNLPSGWNSSIPVGSNHWSTVTGSSDSGANHAFVANPGSVTDSYLTSPAFVLAPTTSRLTFRHLYDTESGYDGGVLEIGVGSTFTDVLAAGGVFLQGGYVSTISTGFSNPIGGRQAWNGNSSAYITTIVDLPSSLYGQSISLRWRFGTDISVSDVGWRVDTINLISPPSPPTQDFGDAPAPFPVTTAENGPRHTSGALRLGTLADVESDGSHSPDATFDGADEDGVGFATGLDPGQTETVNVTSSQAGGLLTGWFDWNRDGDWDDASEKVFNDVALVAGNNALSVTVPAGATLGRSFARFRISTNAGLAYTGSATDGEVEDYSIRIGPATRTQFILDFGAGIGMGNVMSTTVGAFRNIFGPGIGGNGTGSDMQGQNNMTSTSTLDFRPLSYDYDLNGVINNNDIFALQNDVLPIVRRALEPFDIDVVAGAASSLVSAVAAVGENAGNIVGQNDAYNFVMDIRSNAFSGGSVGSNTSLFGIAAADDLFAQLGNRQDEATLSFSDLMFSTTSGTPGTVTFNRNLAHRIAYTATHEGFHTLTYIHTTSSTGKTLLSSGDVIRLGSNTREDPFMVTRFNLERQGNFAVAQPNNYLQAANDPDIGLRDSDRNGIPDFAYVTGTGAHDRITLTNAGGGIVNVSVQAYSDSGRSSLLEASTYSIDLVTQSQLGEILIDGGINADLIVIDSTIAANFRVRGGTGEDPDGGTANDTIQVLGSANHIPGSGGSGRITYAGRTVNYEEIETVSVTDNTAPVVTSVIVASSTWLPGFIDAVDGGGANSGNGLGLEIGAGVIVANQGIDRIYIRFSEPVVGFNAARFALLGSNIATYVTTVSYDSNAMQGFVQLSTPISIDKLRVGVSQGVTDAVSNQLDGDNSGSAGGHFNLRFDVLVGDANSDGSVNGGDLTFFASAFNTSAGAQNYNSRADWNSDGSVNGGDLSFFGTNFNQSLPLSEPGQLNFSSDQAIATMFFAAAPVKVIETKPAISAASYSTVKSKQLTAVSIKDKLAVKRRRTDVVDQRSIGIRQVSQVLTSIGQSRIQ